MGGLIIIIIFIIFFGGGRGGVLSNGILRYILLLQEQQTLQIIQCSYRVPREHVRQGSEKVRDVSQGTIYLHHQVVKVCKLGKNAPQNECWYI